MFFLLCFLRFLLGVHGTIACNALKSAREQSAARSAQRAHDATSRRFLMLALLGLIAGGASAANVNGEMQRRNDNDVRLAKMHPYMRPKIRAVISKLESDGWRPLIDEKVWRSPAQQAQLKRVGYSKVGYSFHMVTDRDAKKRAVPASLAADITDKRWAWKSGTPFWLSLAAAAEQHGLETGIYWGLGRIERGQIRLEIASQNYNAPVKRIGWDPAHVQPRFSTITLGQARRGVRPK